MNIGIYIYDNAEVLDFSGPFEVFSTASRFLKAEEKFNVFLIAESKSPVDARGGYSVNPHYGFDDHPEIDVFIVVGGVHTEELKKPSVINWVADVAGRCQLVASVCTGAFILAQAGLLKNRRVTTHWQDIQDLKDSFPDMTVVESQRWVDEGSIVTSGGISAGIDMSLHLVSRIISNELAEKTAKQMEFEWRKNS
jgi:transcriptional regulator GlxA family with amidase domain